MEPINIKHKSIAKIVGNAVILSFVRQIFNLMPLLGQYVIINQ